MPLESLFDVRGHVAFVTGAASGLGLAMAEVLAENGAIVTLADVNVSNLDAAVSKLRSAGCEVESTVVDVRDAGRVQEAIAAVAAKHGRLDTVFANAGISAGFGYNVASGQLDAIAASDWENVLKVNLTGVFVTLQAAASHMKARRTGRIIVTASISGMRSEVISGYAYVATKAAVINLVRQAAMELAPFNVLVNAIAPGFFYTNLGGGRLRADPQLAARFAGKVPLGRIGQSDEIKGLALFLASPASSYITGALIPIDGGVTAQ
jgi:NAD(P)-dependent dehydrogenase (short-subunit alcohol dehydrogenase family)